MLFRLIKRCYNILHGQEARSAVSNHEGCLDAGLPSWFETPPKWRLLTMKEWWRGLKLAENQ